MKKLSLFLAAALLSASALAQSGSNLIEPIDLSDTFKANVLVAVKDRIEESGGDKRIITLSSEIIKKTGQNEYGLSFLESYHDRGWRRWSRATTDQAESLTAKRIHSEVVSCRESSTRGCHYIEGLIVILPPALIKKAAKEPVRIQLRGDVQEYIYTFKPEEVQALLAAEADTKQKLGK